MLFFCTIVLGCAFLLPKTVKTAFAGTELYSDGAISVTACDELASAAGFTEFGDLVDALNSGSTFKASNFGTYEVKFGNMDWWPVQLSKSGEDIVLTLWLKTSIGNYTFSDGTNSSNSATPQPSCNDYKYSWIRAAINAGQTSDNGDYYGKWSSTNQPTLFHKDDPPNTSHLAPTAFTTFSSIISNPFIIPGSEYSDPIWLPSLNEAKSGGSWGCTSTQWANNGSTGFCWSRSPYTSNYYRVYRLTTSGGTSNVDVYDPYGVRPALSINLKSAAQATVAPADVEVTYNGQIQDISNLSEADRIWYNADRVTLSYHSDIACTTSVSPVNAGEYYIKVTLNNDLDEAGEYKYIFKDSVDPTGEYNTQRWMPVKFTIKKLKLGVTFTYDADGLPSVAWSTTLFPNDTGNEPVLGLKYESTTGAAISDPYSVPTAIGTYKAVAYIVDEASHSYNYELDTSTATSNTFNVTARKIADPVSTTGSAIKTVTYNAASQTMTLQNISADVKYTLSTGLVEDSYDSSTGTLTVSATNAGTYTVKADLADGGAGTVWSSGGTATKTYTLQIDPALLVASITLPTSWEQGTAQTAQITLTGLFGDDSPALSVYYKAAGGSEVTVSGSDGNYLLSEDLAQGTYTFGVRIDSSEKNYTLTEKTHSFTVTAPGAGFTEADLVWQYTVSGNTEIISGEGTADAPIELEYCGEEYAFSLTFDSEMLALKGVTASYSGTTRATNVSDTAYSVTVTISAKDSSVSYETSTHTLYFKITPMELDLSEAQWEYYNGAEWVAFTAGDPEYNKSGIRVRLSEEYLNSLGPDLGNVAITYNNGTKDSENYAIFTTKGSNTVTAELVIHDGNYTLKNNVAEKTFEITKKQIQIMWSSSALTFKTQDTTSTTWGVKITNTDGDYSEYIEYTFVFTDKDGKEQRLSLEEATEYFAANASSRAEDLISGTVYVSVKEENASDYMLAGADLSHSFSVGDGKETIEVVITGSGSEYQKVSFTISAKSGTESFAQDLTVEVYSAGNELLGSYQASNASAIQEFLNTLGVGKYTLCIVAVDEDLMDIYALTPDVIAFEIVPQRVAVPTLINADKIVYRASSYNIADYLNGFDDALMELDELHSEVLCTSAGEYSVTVILKDAVNYVFVDVNAGANTVKQLLRAVLSDGEVETVEVGSSVDIDWAIQKFMITDSMFNTSTGALNLPEQFNEILANEQLQIGYTYYADKTSSEAVTELKNGETYYVVASLGGEAVDNFAFENPSTTSDTVSTRVAFKTPQSGLNAAFGKAMDFFKGEGPLGLPVWAWFLIGLAVLIFLIIIIVVASKRRKNKEERLAKKEAKEEEKRRREEERQMQREKLEAEREMAKAKQEAELEKIRAQAGLGMGAASMAMQQPMQQQIPVLQQQPVQMPVPQQQFVQQQPQVQYVQQPVPAQPVVGAQSADNTALIMAKLEAEFAKQAQQRSEKELADSKLQTEFDKLRAELHSTGRLPASAEPAPTADGQNGDIEMIGMLAAAIWRNIKHDGAAATAEKLKGQIQSEKIAEGEKSYPDNAVITTTTTVDTTKNKPIARSREESRDERSEFTDVDGFYDKYE